ncbi:RPM1-interacting protein 4 [Zea mays]|uniref:RPM1-interacting protein 4 n=1 Tax=Zea mays TaxID=4577 RepID=A0A1D6GD97_MAIZE|nr:RPM1-interacting protein 4 [Zea mays]AQK61597.1 RPM1-interacting protein 4 [Zea mays]|eukprot:XP_020408998.1 nitrate-induced NOI protein isoform X1 [Zea mays]
MAHQGPGVPKFGSWEDEGDHPYTQYFENARKGKSPGRSATQNEHRTGDPEALFKEDTTPSAKASPLRTGSEDPVAPKPKDAAFARGKPYAEPATHKHGANTSYERKTGMERSPLHPHHQARLVNRGGVSSPSWERRGSSEGNRGAAPTTPGRSSKMRPGGRGDETPERGSAVPKFGEWDEKDPSTGEGFTDIFNKVREEKQSGDAPVITSGNAGGGYSRSNQGRKYESSVSQLQTCCHNAGSNYFLGLKHLFAGVSYTILSFLHF